jgi:hypothetical protein
MNNKLIIFFCLILLTSCTNQPKKINYTDKFNNYSNRGFALIYDKNLYNKKLVNNKLNDRSLLIFNKFLKKETPVKITNLINGKYLLAKVGKNSDYPMFYNSVISKRVATDLEIDFKEPYIEIKTLNRNNSFIIGKAKTFDEEKNVANKAPVDGILIKDIANKSKNRNSTNKNLNKKKSFQYIIKIADLYFEDSAIIFKNRLKNEYNIINIKIKKMSKNSYRIYKGPFNNLDSIKREYSDIIKLNFENIEIIKL